MARTCKEWIGKDDDQPFPPRVRLRILKTFGYRCAECSREIVRRRDKWTCDHKVALINGGENRERNGQPLCAWCDPKKTAEDQRLKSVTAEIEKQDYGIKTPSRNPMPGSRNSRWASRYDRATGRWITVMRT
jgi:hypothetical protein